MALVLTVNSVPYSFPEQGANPPWGQDISDWAQAVTDVLNGLQTTGDILTTSFTLNNNVSSLTNITGFLFDVSVVRSFAVDYSIYRTISNSLSVITEEYAESGLLFGTLKSDAATWELTQQGNSVGSTGITLSITPSGQMQYLSSNLTIPVGGSHSGRIVFRARTTTQV